MNDGRLIRRLREKHDNAPRCLKFPIVVSYLATLPTSTPTIYIHLAHRPSSVCFCWGVISIYDIQYLVSLLSHLLKITPRLYQSQTLTLPKSYSDFTKITLRLYQNRIATLPKSHPDFTKIVLRLYQSQTLTLPKSYSDFTKITLRLCSKTQALSQNNFHRKFCENTT